MRSGIRSSLYSFSGFKLFYTELRQNRFERLGLISDKLGIPALLHLFFIFGLQIASPYPLPASDEFYVLPHPRLGGGMLSDRGW